MLNRTSLCFMVVGLSALAGSVIVTAGPLDPPTGVIAPSYKTLTEVEPRTALNTTNTPGDADSTLRITKSGSYYLTGDLVAKPGNFSGIEVAASNVTIDLMGFSISGEFSSSRAGIAATSGQTNITVKNGTVRGFNQVGIDLTATAYATLEGVTVQNCAGGVSMGNGARLARCAARTIAGVAYSLSFGSVVEHCIAAEATGDGFRLGVGSSVVNCEASSVAGIGFVASGSSLANCTTYSAATGFVLTESNATGCTARSSTATGFQLDRSTADACIASNNGSRGFSVTTSSITNCTATSNTTAGIYVSFDSLIRGNVANYNGTQGGIYVAGDGSRIEGNNCGFQPAGITLNSAGNILIRNTCRGNSTNYA
ncbi:MAG TPA: right-handed parallel beta-helix repeat-containing protein, partial [Phycisphaerales bacterium]|nr:right-handed parallel beta-helix repeat-containing protein [Phycisphaerales bacterium]